MQGYPEFQNAVTFYFSTVWRKCRMTAGYGWTWAANGSGPHGVHCVVLCVPVLHGLKLRIRSPSQRVILRPQWCSVWSYTGRPSYWYITYSAPNLYSQTSRRTKVLGSVGRACCSMLLASNPPTQYTIDRIHVLGRSLQQKRGKT